MNLLMFMDVMCNSCASGKLNPCHSKEARIACYLQSLEISQKTCGKYDSQE